MEILQLILAAGLCFILSGPTCKTTGFINPSIETGIVQYDFPIKFLGFTSITFLQAIVDNVGCINKNA